MKIIYISSMFEKKDFEAVFDDANKVPQAANKFNSLFCKGFAKNGMDVSAFAILPVTRQNCRKVWIKGKKYSSDGVKYCYQSTINMKGIKNIVRCSITFFKILFSPNDSCIIFDLFTTSANIGMIIAAKIRKFRRICVVTDLPEMLTNDRHSSKIHDWILYNSSDYVILTEQMAEKVDKTGLKKKIVVEGVSDSDYKVQATKRIFNAPKIVMYAGTLKRQYGVENLINSFIECCQDNEELHLYGSGEYAENIKEISKRYSNIIYHGVCSNDDVVYAEKNAILLVNPRTSEGDYTKYSFPSKVMEYMTTGTPVLMAKLPGIPKEYYDYCLTFDDNDKDGLKSALRKALDLDNDKLLNIGINAQKFVLENKNNIKQAKKVIDALQLKK